MKKSKKVVRKRVKKLKAKKLHKMHTKRAMKKKTIKTKMLVVPKRKRGRPRKNGITVVNVPKRKRGRPRKNEFVPQDEPKKKRGRPRKVDQVVEAPKKRGRPRKVKETKEDVLRKVAKLGKRKYKKAVEQMALEKINKKIRRKNTVGNGGGQGEAVGTRTISYDKQSAILAGPNKAPVGVGLVQQKEKPTLSVEESVKARLRERGYVWKENTFKVVDKTPSFWTVKFMDKEQGEIVSYNDVTQFKKAVAENKEQKEDPKLAKNELERYVKKLKASGHNPQDIRVIENKPEYFTIEFRDGTDGPITKCSHAKSWDIKE